MLRASYAPAGRPTAAALAREAQAAERIPYTTHVTGSIVRTRQGDYVFAIQLQGAAFETADDVQINQWHERLNLLLRNIAAPNVALWSHIVRRRDTRYPAGVFPPGFARHLDARYRARLARETVLANALYVSVVWRGQTDVVSGWLQRMIVRRDPDAQRQAQADALDGCTKLQQHLLAALADYGARLLGVRERGGHRVSEVLEFFAELVNGESQPMPLPRGPIAELLATTRPFFGAEALEYRMATRTRLGAMLGIKEYPTPSVPDMFHKLLTAPFPFVQTQSFTFLSKAAAQGLMQAQYNRMRNAGDLARSQIDELHEALDALTSNAFVLGEHHFTLQVLADPYDGVREAEGAPRLAQLNDHIALAREVLADTGMVVAREDLALEAGFWAQLPGNFAYRPRRAPITSRNFAAMSPLHNFPSGQPDGNHWGEALALLTTRARSPYHFSLHAPDVEGGGATDVGHTFICGPTGSGKTVFLGFCVAMLHKHGATQVLLDKDRGLEVLVRALGGAYLPLKTGQPTGFNPLRLEPTPLNVLFLKDFLRRLVEAHRLPLTARQEADLEQALRGVLALEPAERRLSRVLEHLDATDLEGLHPRLARWCAVSRGEFAWAFDGTDDAILPLLSSNTTIGFDVTEFLDFEAVRAPVTMYLFHLVRQVLDGRRFVCWCDEFWKLLTDPAFEAFSRDGPKTWRKLNGVFAAATQSAGDVLQSAISRTLVEQTATKVFFPNPEARADDYIDGFGLTEREYRLVREELSAGAHEFLIKQGHRSVVCRLDLDGFDGELAVLSGRATSIERLQRLIERLGPAPDQWLETFMAEAATGRTGRRAAASAAHPAPPSQEETLR